MDKYMIVARQRQNNKRIPITIPMSRDEAMNWEPHSDLKRYYKYFRVVKYKN